jgi:deoxyribonuclease V
MDVQYQEDERALSAGVVFNDWKDAEPVEQVVVEIDKTEPYVSGQFYKRELPCLLAVLKQLSEPVDVIVVDGYVDLRPGQPGLGRYLFNELGGRVQVVGVAKTAFLGAHTTPVLRGESRKPLFVTSSGGGAARFQAAIAVREMHGQYRFPTLLKRVDSLARGTISP